MPVEGLGLTISLHDFFERSFLLFALSNFVLELFENKLVVYFDFADVVDLLPIFVESV